MLNFIINLALRNRLFVIVVALTVMLYGAYQATQLPVEVLPDLTKPTVTIMTEAPGKSPEDVELLVTQRIEKALSGIQGVTRIRSTTDVALSLVFVEFEWDTDIYRARQFVQERLQTIELDDDVQPLLTPVASLMGEIMLIGITSPNGTVDPKDLRVFSDWTLSRRIKQMPGVAESLSMGAGVKQIQVQPKPQQMLAYGISLEEINKAVSEASNNSTGGFFNSQSQEQMIRLLAMTTDLDKISRAVVKKIDDRTITVGDVADVKWGVEPMRGDAGVMGKAGVVLGVTKAPGVDTRRLTAEVKSLLDDMQKKLDEDGRDIKLTPLFQQEVFIDAAMTNLWEAIRDGAIMVVIVLFVFLFSIKSPMSSLMTTLITLTAIPLSFAVTILIFSVAGLSVNSMTLGGLAVAIGIVVDDAIVDVENVLRRLRENAGKPKPEKRLIVIARASGEVRNSILYATIFIVLVFVPLLSLSGVEGRLFTPIAVATMVSMGASFVVSLTVIPVLCSLFLRPRENVQHKDGVIIASLKKLLEWTFLKAALRTPTLTIAFGMILLVFSVFLYGKLGKEFLPGFKEETMIIATATAPGTSLETTQKLALQMSKKLLDTIPEIKTIGHRAGRAERGDHVVPVSTVEFDIEFRKHKKGDRDRKEVEEAIHAQLKEVKGTFSAISGPLTDRIGHMLSGVSAKVAIKIKGDDLTQIREIGKKVQDICKSIPGLETAKMEQQAFIPQLQIIFDVERGAAYNVNAKTVNAQMANLLGGANILGVYEGERTIDIVTRLPLHLRDSMEKIKALYIDTEDGHKIPLSLVADVRPGKGPNVIKRENNVRLFVVAVNPTVRDLQGAIRELERKIKEQIPESSKYDISIEGEYQAQQKATKSIIMWSLIILVIVIVLLFSYFGSMNFAIQVIMDIPLSLIGAIAFTYIMDLPISIASLVGFIAVAGISARNSIMLISHWIHLMQHEGMEFGKEMIIRGTKERLLPVLMTAFSAGIALIPLVLAKGESGKEILSPIAIAITGGLISSTILGLMVTPAVYYLFGRKASINALKRRVSL